MSCSPRRELGTNSLHVELEKLTAQFVGVEDTIVFGMGFATNALNLPAFLSPGCLVLSDEKNHASIILGLRLSGATIRVFKHNNMQHLEKQLQDAIVNGQPKTGAPWKKILIIAEGVYSMEGSIVKLPEIVALKKKYKAYLYLDEAHSIGAMGPRGRGVVDYYGVDPNDIDILMGTFTKSFASSGGYIAGSKVDFLIFISLLISDYNPNRAVSEIDQFSAGKQPCALLCIEYVAARGPTNLNFNENHHGIRWHKRRPTSNKSISPEHKILPTKISPNRCHHIRPRRFTRCAHVGVFVFKNCVSRIELKHSRDSHSANETFLFCLFAYRAVVRTLTKRNIAVVGVGFPATPIMAGRIRFCLSASHTKEQLDYAIKVIDEESSALGLKYSRRPRNYDPIEY